MGTDSKGEKRERRCGQCNACCISFPVDPLNKPAFVACEHLVELESTYGDTEENSGCCGIYEDRPSACKSFQCSWLEDVENIIPQDMSPLQSGLIFETTYLKLPEPIGVFYMFIVIEHVPGAFAKNAGRLNLIGIENECVFSCFPRNFRDKMTQYGHPQAIKIQKWWTESIRRNGNVQIKHKDGETSNISVADLGVNSSDG